MLSTWAGLFAHLFTSCSQEFVKGGLVERGLGCLYLGVFFAAAAATSKQGSLPGDGGEEILGVIRSILRDDLVEWWCSADRLYHFLKLAFGIDVQRAVMQRSEILGKEMCGKALCCVVARIEVNGPGDGFQGIRERGVTIAATIGLFATAHAQMGAESDAACDACERLGGDQLRTCLREDAFIGLWQSLEEQMGKSELQHGIAQEFEALVVGLCPLCLIADTAVRERELEQRGIAKSVTENGFQRVHAWRRSKPLEQLRSSEKIGVTDGIRTRNNQNHNLGLYR